MGGSKDHFTCGELVWGGRKNEAPGMVPILAASLLLDVTRYVGSAHPPTNYEEMQSLLRAPWDGKKTYSSKKAIKLTEGEIWIVARPAVEEKEEVEKERIYPIDSEEEEKEEKEEKEEEEWDGV